MYYVGVFMKMQTLKGGKDDSDVVQVFRCTLIAHAYVLTTTTYYCRCMSITT